jgi:hypothetical protein
MIINRARIKELLEEQAREGTNADAFASRAYFCFDSQGESVERTDDFCDFCGYKKICLPYLEKAEIIRQD